MFVLFALLAPLASGVNVDVPQLVVVEKVPFQVIFDTTCSDCQDWVRTQFKPLWEDEKFRPILTSNFDFNMVAKSVTRHEQGDELNKVLNCANKYTRREVFLPALFCWEGSVEAWVMKPDRSGFDQARVDIDGVVNKCFANQLSPQEMGALQKCRGDSAEGAALASYVQSRLPANFDEVPWVTISTSEFAMEGNDEAIYRLRDYLCKTYLSSSDACAAQAAGAFMARPAGAPVMARKPVPEAATGKEPWSCKL